MARINRKIAACIVVAFVLLDLLIASVLFLKNDRIGIRPNGNPFVYFDIRTSQIDHCSLALLRSAILVGALIGVSYNWRTGPGRLKSMAIYAVCACLAMLVYSPFKLLTLAEATTDFRLPWFWILFAWNILASAGCALIWLFVLSKVQPKIDDRRRERRVSMDGKAKPEEELIEHKLIYGAGTPQFEPVQVVGTEEKEAEKPKSMKEVKDQVKATTSTLWRLIKYCKREWVWYVFGFLFLILYSSGEWFYRFTDSTNPLCPSVFLLARIFIPRLTGRVISDIVVYQSYDRLRESVMWMSVVAVAR